MTKCQLLLMLAAALLVAGCTDNVDTVSREYRAANNECIDALTMVTSESTARRMTKRVFKPMSERYEDIDRRLKIVFTNRDKGPFVKEVLASDNVHLYLSDLALNSQRYDLERLRLKRIVRHLVDEAGGGHPKDICPFLLDLVYNEGPDAIGAGVAPKGGGGPAMPNLPGMPGGGGGGAPPGGAPPGGAPPGMPGGIGMPGMGGGGMAQRNDGVLEPLRRQLFDSDLSKMIADFPSWKINGYKDMHDKFMKRRVEFLPKEPIKLVN